MGMKLRDEWQVFLATAALWPLLKQMMAKMQGPVAKIKYIIDSKNKEG
jgi:hypothetical protein